MAARRVLVIRQAVTTYDPRVIREVNALLGEGFLVDLVSARDAGEALRERDGALTVYRVPLPGRRGASASVYLARSAIFFAIAAVLGTVLALRRRYVLVQVHSLPDTLVFAALGPRLLGARVTLDMHEPFVEFFETRFGSHRPLLVRLVAAAEQASIRFADFAYTCTEEMRDAFVERGADRDRLGVVLNAADEDVFDVTRFPPLGGDGRRFTVLCHGTVERRYGIDTAIEAVAKLAPDMPHLYLEVMGSGPYLEEARSLAVSRGISDRVSFNASYVPADQLCEAIARCDAGLVAMKRDRFRDLTHCNKMYDFMTMQRPVLMSRTRSVQAYFGEDCFEYFDSEDPADLAEAIRRVHGDPERSAILVQRATEALEPYRWERQRQVYLAYVDQVLGSNGNGGAASELHEHWSRIGATYTAEWDPPARNALGARELEFIADALQQSRACTALDVGVGSGRILAELLRRTDETVFYGLDLAETMVEATRERLAGEPRLRGLATCDLASEAVPFEGRFDFISAIRMLKYNPNWREMVAKLVDRLQAGGVIVFTMPNPRSLNALARPYAVEGYAATPRELRELCRELGLRPLTLDGFTKLPHRLYSGARTARSANALLAIDRGLRRAIGGPALTREIFVLARRE